MCADEGEKEEGGESKGRVWGRGEGGCTAVLTAARLIHPEHAELLCFAHWLQVNFRVWIRSWLWLRTSSLCAALAQTLQSYLASPTTAHSPSSSSHLQQSHIVNKFIPLLTNRLVSLHFSQHYQTKGSGYSGDSIIQKLLMLSLCVCTWNESITEAASEWLAVNSLKRRKGDVCHRSI